MTNKPEPDWKTIAENLASSLGDFNTCWASEARGSMYGASHEAMIAYYEATGFDWRSWYLKQGIVVCKCHGETTAK